MKPYRRSCSSAAILAAVILCSTTTATELADPGFDDGPLGMVASIGSVVRPLFQVGHWGAELAYIVESTGNVHPRSLPYMLQMLDTGPGMIDTQALQAVYVPFQFDYAEMRAWTNGETAATFGLKIHFFEAADSWPEAIGAHQESFTLDASPHTWEQFTLQPLAVPAAAQWIVAEVNFLNATLDGHAGYVDDVELIFHGVVAGDAMTWTAVKGLFRPAASAGRFR